MKQSVDELLEKLKSDCNRYKEISLYIPHLNFRHARDMWRGLTQEMWSDDGFRRYIYNEFCSGCIFQFSCKLISYTKRAYKNVIINEYLDEKELIYFEEPLYCIEESVNVDRDGGRNYIKIDNCLIPKDENISNAKFLENMDNSARQSRDAFWGYALSNHWDYFITLTTDKLKVNRYDDEAVKRLWRICRQKLQRFDKDVKILLVPERHKDGALHFHGLIAMNRPFELKEFRINGELVRAKRTNAPCFVFPFWNFGMASFAIIQTDNNVLFKGETLADVVDENGILTTSQRRVVAYMDKYIAKQLGSIGYCCKSFYKTKNVKAKNKIVSYMNAEELSETLRRDNYELYKNANGKLIFRQKFCEGNDENS